MLVDCQSDRRSSPCREAEVAIGTPPTKLVQPRGSKLKMATTQREAQCWLERIQPSKKIMGTATRKWVKISYVPNDAQFVLIIIFIEVKSSLGALEVLKWISWNSLP